MQIDETITELERLVRDAEIRAGVERREESTDSETAREMYSGVRVR